MRKLSETYFDGQIVPVWELLPEKEEEVSHGKKQGLLSVLLTAIVTFMVTVAEMFDLV